MAHRIACRIYLILACGVLLSACSTPEEDPAGSDLTTESEVEVVKPARPAMQPNPANPELLDVSREAIQRSLQQSVSLEDEPVGEAVDQLPDMFEAEADERKMKVSGSVLTNEEAESLSDSVDGVEFKLEVKTN